MVLIKKKQSGQSLVEVVVAIAISALIIVGLLVGAVIGVRNVQFSRHQSQAMELNREASEWLRVQKELGWSSLWNYGSAAGSQYCLADLSFNISGSCDWENESELVAQKFARQLVLRQSDSGRLEVVITTGWHDAAGDHSEIATTYLTKY